jgi:hypothetical protein
MPLQHLFPFLLSTNRDRMKYDLNHYEPISQTSNPSLPMFRIALHEEQQDAY